MIVCAAVRVSSYDHAIELHKLHTGYVSKSLGGKYVESQG